MKKILIFLVAISFVSCSDGKVRSDSSASAPQVYPEESDSTSEKVQDRVNEIEKSILSSRNQSVIQKNKVSQDNYSNKRFLLKSDSHGITPMDFTIGELSTSGTAAGSPEHAVISFLQAYSKNNFQPSAFFTAENATFLSMLFQEWSSEGLFPEAARIGREYKNGDTAKVNVRSYKDGGISCCEFFMKKEGEKWKINNISGNFTDMNYDYIRPEKEFEPEIYYFF
ncbi:MAG: hypothetical protein MJ215_03805 [Spirochaetia bacterium]|nr:hypothetical protein [Spirochaetia bacterium]